MFILLIKLRKLKMFQNFWDYISFQGLFQA